MTVGWMGRLRRLAGGVVLLCCAVALSITPAGTAAADDPAYTVAQETLDALADARPGDRIRVTIRMDVPNLIDASLEAPPSLCSVPLPGGAPDSDYRARCRTSLGGGLPIADTGSEYYPPDPNGVFSFSVAIPPEGDNTWTAGGELPAMSCAPGDRCTIAVKINYTTDDFQFVDLPVDLTSLAFTVKEPNAFPGCQPAASPVDLQGPPRLSQAYVNWVQARCASGGSIDMDYLAGDEVDGRDNFRSGTGTVFLGGGGTTLGEDASAAAERPSVAVPVGLNAEVIAIYGKYFSSGLGGSPRTSYVDDIRLTADQLAAFMVNPGLLQEAGGHNESISAANPQIALPPLFQRDVNFAGYTTPDVGHWMLSGYLAQRAPGAWRYPNTSNYERPGEAIGELWRLDSLNPGGGNSHQLAANRPGLNKIVNEFFFQCGTLNGCLRLVVTDAATAADLGLPVVKLQNAAGEYVAPTPETMARAAGQMKRLPDGTLVPDPDADGRGAYPLTFVEYAHAPACTGLEGADRVKDVLGYMSNAGQQRLPAGMGPLPSNLRSEAAAAVAKVGAQTTGGCSAANNNGGGGGGGGAPVAGTPGGSGASGLGGAAASTTAGAAGDHPTRPVTPGGQQQALKAAEGTRIPLFAGLAALVLIVPISALALSNVVTSGSAYGTSGRHGRADLLAGWTTLRTRTRHLARRARLVRAKSQPPS